MANVKKWKRGGRRTVWRCDYLDAGDVRRRKTFATKEAAEDFHARTVLEGRQHLTPVVAPDTKTQAYCDRVVAALPLKQATRETYAKALRLYVYPTLAAVAVRDLRRARIKRVLLDLRADLKGRGKAGDAIVSLTLAVISKMFSAAVSDELVVANPVLRLGPEIFPKDPPAHPSGEEQPAGEEARDMRAFTRPERDLFLATAREEDRWCARLWTVQVLTGLRPGEMYALTENDLVLDPPAPTPQEKPKGPQVRVSKTLSENGKRVELTPKSGRMRMVDLSAGAVDALRAHLGWRKQEKLRRGWREMPKPLFFAPDGGYLLPCDIRKRMYAVLQAAGLSQRGPHALRHTYATLALNAGQSIYYVSKQLGHRDSSITTRVYTRGDDASHPGALDVLDPPAAVTNL